ncbi:hypothetical protein FACS1894145_7100 [Bacteroidia bacterium]|nr:hypothetical protein FACS1894145_7100 [Bacteroidia bacterium]
MREKMKKMLFLMLFLLILGAANVISQVRIGGNGQPNGAAVLDLNATDATINGTKGLALPRVSLSSNMVQIASGTPNLSGMLVYNTNTTLGTGVYYWDGNKWAKVSDGSFVEGDAIVGNEISDTIANGGLTRSGAGTAVSPYKVGIKTSGIVNGMIADGAVSLDKLSSSPADSGSFLIATGSGVATVGFFDRQINNPATVTTRAARSVTWTNILDTAITLTFYKNTITNIAATGIYGGELCLPGNHGWGLRFVTTGGIIQAFSVHNEEGSEMLRIRCYRPSL